jgi:hypothetical protein
LTTPATLTVRCSALPILWRCPESQLAVPGEVILNQSSEPAECGNGFHRWMASHIQGVDLDIAQLAKEHGVDEDELRMLVAMGCKALASLKKHFEECDGPLMVETALEYDIGNGIVIRGSADLMGRQKRIALVLDWKGLPIETPIPTPQGWTVMGALQTGDVVFGGDGKPCRVLGISEVNERACFEVVFDDTTTVVCDDQHLWKLNDGRVVPIKELRAGDLIPVAGSLDLPAADLPLDPYVLGLWLGDGKHTSGEICKPDAFVFEEVRRRGFEVGGDISGRGVATRCQSRTVMGLRTKLGEMGLLRNKHVPPAYFRGSYQQRLDLLCGLMDSDGNANPTRKQAVFTSCDKRLSDDVRELLLTLGQRPNQCETKQRGFGKTVKAFPIHFRPLGLNPFLMPRKASRIDPYWGRGESWRRRVEVIRPVPSRLTKCIKVDSPDSTYLCTRNLIPTHNTGRVESDYSHQVRGYAYGAMEKLATKVPLDIDEVVVIVVWVREGIWDIERFPVAQLKSWAEELHRRIRNGRGNFNPGGHCTYCPRAAACPGRRALVRSAMSDLTRDGMKVMEWTKETRAALGPQIGEAFGRMKLVERAAEDFRRTIKEDVEQHGPISIGGGRQLAISDVNKRVIDPAKARAVLPRFLTQDEIDRATKLSAGELDDLVAAKAGKGNGASMKRQLSAALEQAGAVSINVIHTLRECKEQAS